MLEKASQARRYVKLSTPLGEDKLLFRRMEGTEALGELFEWRVEAYADDEPPDENDLVGHDCCVELGIHEGQRFFQGICTEFRWIATSHDRPLFELTLRPFLWLLTLRSDSRFFLDKKIDEIIKAVLDEAGFSNFRFVLDREHAAIPYCVQYQETNFDFILRLMEKHGLYYFFESAKERYELIITDTMYAHKAAPGYEEIPYRPSRDARVNRDYILQVQQSDCLRVDKITVNDYDYQRASGNLQITQSFPAKHRNTGNALYGFQSNYRERDLGDALARVMLEAHRAGAKRIRAIGTTAGLFAGCKTKIEDDPLPQPGQDLVCVAARHTIASDEYRTSTEGELEPYSGEFELMPWLTPFRMPQRTPWPRITGPHTAKVAGQDGEEIDVDEHGRILVTFHWDRSSQKSCRVRVAQTLAGSKFGSTHIPRIGHEVLVSFIDGDPDRPIVTGTVYNSDNKPPVDLPANKTQTGLKSNSSKGGGGANEINIDDKKDSETFSVTAEKDFIQTVKNDATVSIGFEKAQPGSFVQKVKQDWTEEVESGNHKITVKAGNSTVTVASGRKETIEAGGDALDVTGKRTVNASEEYKVTTPKATIHADNEAEIESTSTTLNGKSKTVIGEMQIEVTGTIVKVSGAMSIELVSGPSSIKLDASGVTVVGPMIKLN